MQDKMLKCRTICKIMDSWQVCLLLLAKTTCFNSNQIFRLGGCLLFCLIHLRYVFCQKLLLANNAPFCGYDATRVWNWHAFIIRLISDSPACRLESLGTRLSHLSTATGAKLGSQGSVPSVTAIMPWNN